MNTKLARLRLACAFLLALCAVAALLFATPQGRAWAQEALGFFTRANTDRLPIQPWQLTPISTTTTPDPASITGANQTVKEVEQQAGYAVLKPTWLPEILSFEAASLEPEHNIARLFYKYVDTNGLVLREEPVKQTEACELCGVVGASAAVEKVQIGANPGEYVEGVWKLTDNGPVWEPDPYLKTLRWQSNGMAFELLYMGPPDSLTKDDLIHIAEGIQ